MDVKLDWNMDHGDLVMQGGDLATSGGLWESVLRSLMEDRLANEDDLLPDSSGDRRGGWQDFYLDVPGDLEGSRLWLKRREKDIPETYRSVNEICTEALQWLLDDKVAANFTVTSYRIRAGVMGILIKIYKSSTDKKPVELPYQFAWEGL